jgi:hypothetical protein
MQNAIVKNPTGIVGLVGLPQFEILVIMGGVVVVAAVVIAFTTRGRLGLERPSESGCAPRPSGPSVKGYLFACHNVTIDPAREQGHSEQNEHRNGAERMDE